MYRRYVFSLKLHHKVGKSGERNKAIGFRTWLKFESIKKSAYIASKSQQNCLIYNLLVMTNHTHDSIKISRSFKNNTIKAVVAILLFITVYITLIIFAVALTIGGGYAGIMMIAFKPTYYTIMIGLGVLSMGFLVLIFLFKFVFKRHVVDRSLLLEITEEQEPKLFQFIRTLVGEVNTDFPKKIYLSSEVNAAVFYDSSFWSMFFPIKKNLLIGLGLVGTVSLSEFKAILAHEFGHFSQRTMKVGSYVYYVNQVIYNMLFDNESFDSLALRWSSASNYFSFFVAIAIKIIHGIQWLLKTIYNIVNIAYMGLSREMEFYADEVAAHVAGSKPLITSLLRMDLSNYAFNSILQYYNGTIANSVKSQNVFKEQRFVMNFLAEKNKLNYEHALPDVTLERLSKFNKSKLNIKDQWASHPHTTERVLALKKLDKLSQQNENLLAITLFQNIDATEVQLTELLFKTVTYSQTPAIQKYERFVKDYSSDFEKNSLPDFYNGYYDNKNPEYLDDEQLLSNIEIQQKINLKEYFNDEKVNLLYISNALENDIEVLTRISHGEYKVDSFDYDGKKYFPVECERLISELNSKLEELKAIINENDNSILLEFLTLSQRRGKKIELMKKYREFVKMEKECHQKYQLCMKLLNATNFVNVVTPYEIIEEKMREVREIENEFKSAIQSILQNGLFQETITYEIRESFDKYLSRDWVYFGNNQYYNDALKILFASIQGFREVVPRAYFNAKKDILEYQITLIDN
jgi:Zn-dependent protease with chaperone function